jgi:DNA-directed RNA polymerase specialized sigma24 family protein
MTADGSGGDVSNQLAVAVQQAWEQAHQRFTRLRDLHARAVLGFLCKRAREFGVYLDQADLDNLSQEVWMLSWQGLSKPGSFRPGCFRAWLLKIALNCLRQWLVKRQRYRRQLSFDPDRLPSSWTRSSPLQQLHCQELKRRLETFLEALKALERLDAGGMINTLQSLPEAKVGRPRKDVELHRAVQHLHKCVCHVMDCIHRVQPG